VVLSWGTIPFQIACQAIAILWCATAGHDPADIDDRRSAGPLVRIQGRAVYRRHE
jgi:hypothetical protein